VLLLIIKVLHIACAAVWWGVPMSMSRDIRVTVPLGEPHWELLMIRVNRTRLIAIGAGLATILSGVMLILLFGGFASVPIAIHIGFGLAFCLLLSEVFWESSVWGMLVKQLESKEDADVLNRQVRKFSVIGGVQHTLWFCILVLMVFRYV
jgi:hypothetical protein